MSWLDSMLLYRVLQTSYLVGGEQWRSSLFCLYRSKGPPTIKQYEEGNSELLTLNVRIIA